MAEYRIAVATSDGRMVDSHFGHVSNFLILKVDEDTDAFEEIEDRDVSAACSGGECGATVRREDILIGNGGCGGNGCGGGNGAEASAMDAIAQALSDVQYVLCARIGPPAIKALAKREIRAYDIVLPIDEAVKKINVFRKRINRGN